MVFIILIFISIFGGYFAYSGLVGAVWVPTRRRDIQAMLFRPELPAGGTFLELGSGTGSVILTASSRYQTCVGVEINPTLTLISRLRTARKRNVTIHHSNLWQASLRDADVVYFFLMPRFMPRLEEKILSEVKTGSYVISYTFPLPNLTPKLHAHNCYVYQIETSLSQQRSA